MFTSRSLLNIGLVGLLAVITGCSGLSSEELRRQQLLKAQQAEQAARQAKIEAERRKTRLQTRRKEAQQSWENNIRLSNEQIDALFGATPSQTIDSKKTYFVEFDLQPGKYQFHEGKQKFTLVGMRNLPNSEIYGPLFPDESAQYQPGHKAKSVLEFALKEETELNRIGQTVLKDGGQRWVAATLNFKDYNYLTSMSAVWSWESGLFDDLAWRAPNEVVFPHTENRDVKILLGFRFCVYKDRCYLDSSYRSHPTHAVRAEVVSALIGNKETGVVLGEFIYPGE